MQPSREAMEWGRRQAAHAPHWNERKWSRIATIFQVTFTENISEEPAGDARRGDDDQADEHMPGAA
ncbi:hypothetical protein GCM10022221_79370 [Actinocorallia aurea]